VISVLAGSAFALALTPAGVQHGESAYVLGEYRGCVAVYEPGAGVLPSRVTDIPVHRLPASDQSRIRRGIAVETRQELLMLLEDFSS
jgi:hypothetical protein